MKWPVHHKSRHKDKTLFFSFKEMQAQKEAASRFMSLKVARHLCHFIVQTAPFHRVFCVILSCEMSQIAPSLFSNENKIKKESSCEGFLFLALQDGLEPTTP